MSNIPTLVSCAAASKTPETGKNFLHHLSFAQVLPLSTRTVSCISVISIVVIFWICVGNDPSYDVSLFFGEIKVALALLRLFGARRHVRRLRDIYAVDTLLDKKISTSEYLLNNSVRHDTREMNIGYRFKS